MCTPQCLVALWFLGAELVGCARALAWEGRVLAQLPGSHRDIGGVFPSSLDVTWLPGYVGGLLSTLPHCSRHGSPGHCLSLKSTSPKGRTR